MALDRIAAAPAAATPHRTVVDAIEPMRRDESVPSGLAEIATARLAGLATLGRPPSAGDLLLVKVIGTGERLDLLLLDPRVRSGAAAPAAVFAENEQTAMRPDQLAWTRQVVWRPPDAQALGTSWHAALIDQLEQRAALRAMTVVARAAGGRAAAAVHPPTESSGPIHEEDGPHALPGRPAVADPWLLAAYAWGGLRLLLRVSTDHPARGGAPRPRGACVLRMSVRLPGLGGLIVQLQLAPGGVLLDLTVERGEALQPLRDRLPAVVAALARADLRVLRFRMLRGPPGADTAELPALGSDAPRPPAGPPPDDARGAAASTAAPPGLAADALLPPALFRAAAEVLWALVTPSAQVAAPAAD